MICRVFIAVLGTVLLSMVTYGQYEISGIVLADNTPDEILVSHPVFLVKEGQIVDKVHTNHNGRYYFSVPIDMVEKLLIKTVGFCDTWQVYSDSIDLYTDTSFIIIDFKICHKYADEACEAKFDIIRIDSLTFSFEPHQKLEEFIDYYWQFGDSISSNALSPVHHYDEVGIYQASLTMKNPLQCIDSVSNEVLASNESYIRGTVQIENNHLSDAYIWLIGFDHDFNSIIKTIPVLQEGKYSFWCNSHRKYYLKVLPDFDYNNYLPRVIPTYYGGATQWREADILDIDHEIRDIDLDVICTDFEPHGFNEIHGKICYDKDIDQLPISIYLLDSDMQPIDFAPIIDDHFMFYNLPQDTYYVLPECAGKVSNPALITFHSEFDNPVYPEFFVSTTQINPVGIEHVDYDDTQVKLYPIPVRNKLIVETKKPIEKVNVFNVAGTIKTGFEGDNRTRLVLPASRWLPGVYLIKVYFTDQTFSYKTFVK